MNMSIEKSDTVFHNLPQRRKGYKGFCIETSLATSLYPCPCSIENGKLKIENDSVANHFQLSIVNCQLKRSRRYEMPVADGMSAPAKNPAPSGVQTSRAASPRRTYTEIIAGVEKRENVIATTSLRDNVQTQCIASLRRTYTEIIAGVEKRENVIAATSLRDNVQTQCIASLRRTRDNQPQSHRDGMPAGIRTIIIDSTSPERATSIAQWQRPVNTSSRATSLRDNVRAKNFLPLRRVTGENVITATMTIYKTSIAKNR
jgi:hypothetical protein